MFLTETATATTLDTAAPASFTCAQCPFARLIEDNRYCCQVSQTASDVKRGHWEATVSCFEALAKAEAEKVAEPAAEVVEAPIAQTETPAPAAPAVTRAPSKPAPASHTVTTAAVIPAPAAVGEGDEPPNRGDNGRGRVQPIAPKKLNLSLVAVKRITSDIPATNFDQFDLEIAGELMLSIGGFIVPPVLVRDSSGYKVVSGHLQFHAAVQARQLNPRKGETIPAIILEEENQAAALNQLLSTEIRSLGYIAPSRPLDGAFKGRSILHNVSNVIFRNAQNDSRYFQSARPTSHRSRHSHRPIN